jgi:hypothetical protein
MDNEADYGKCFFQLSYKEAIAQRIISDYKILTIAVSDERVDRVIKENRILNLGLRDLDEAEARAVAAGVALKRVEKRGVTHAISFHSSIRAAKRFQEQQDVLNRLKPRTTNLHISSKKTAGERADLLREFVGKPRALMTNARCLTEGVDVPAIDCVVFADPKQSRIDIVQAAGRALRRYEGKDYGYILLPLVIPRGMGFEEFAETTAFRQVARIVTALSIQDERIADEFRAVLHGRRPSGKIVEISGDVPLGMHMSLGQFAKAISTRIWQSVGRANWRKFEDARAFAHSLKLKSKAEWQNYSKSAKRPSDIPTDPSNAYADAGWVNFRDWLGNPQMRAGGVWRSFKDARAFTHSLRLKNGKQWKTYSKSAKRPSDIPSHPDAVYANAGWVDWGDWFGLSPRSLRSFEDARTFVRGLKLKNVEEWQNYCRSGKKPDDIPTKPSSAYADAGWVRWSDWLGSKRRIGGWRSFNDARAFVRGLKLKSQVEWQTYVKSGKKPIDIPTNPNAAYADAGWVVWGDWLGTRWRHGGWRSFKDARAFTHGLKLKNSTEWRTYCRSGKKPDDIPANPNMVYADTGWVDFRDWLGNSEMRAHVSWRSFEEARAFVRGLKLKGQVEWQTYAKSGKKPIDWTYPGFVER